jgi:hypothetical protein
MNALHGDLFKNCFASWVEALRDGDPGIIAIDGKTSRRSHTREPLHMVPAWATRQRLMDGEEATEAIQRDHRHAAASGAPGTDRNPGHHRHHRHPERHRQWILTMVPPAMANSTLPSSGAAPKSLLKTIGF